jgi:hypothetical protein
LRQDRVEVTNAQPRGNKIFTNKGEGIPESLLLSFVRGAIDIGENPGGMGRVKVALSINVVFIGNEIFKIKTKPLGYHKTTTSTTRSNLSHEKETESVENSRNL